MSNYRYQIEQYHSIEKADIAINGITVLAGVNGAGKSTLSRWLYYIVNISTIYDTNRFEEYQQNLGNEIRQYATAKKEFAESNDEVDMLSKARKSILDINYNGIETADEVLSIYMAATKQFCEEWKKVLPTMNHNALTRISNFLHFEKISNGSDDTLIERFLEERMKKGTSEKESFFLAIKKRPIEKFFEKTRKTYHETDRPNSISFQEDGVEIITDKKIGSLLGLDDAIYIDTPMALSVTDSTNQFWNELLFMLKNQDENIDISREAKNMLKRITLITGGEVIEKKDVFGQKELFYTRNSDNLTIKLENAATGIKTFAFIEQLLRKGYLTNRTVLIIDEPEAHLHPQWIVEFARLLVLLNKEIGLKIMVASHDPDMVSAIRYVSEAEGTLDYTNFYIAEQNGNSQTYTYKNLGNDIEPIFVSFNKSFELIEKYGVDNG